MTWHPLLDAVESPTGTWTLVDPDGARYGTVEIRRVMNGTDTRYRCSFRGDVIGWAVTLKAGVERVHRAFLAVHGPSGGPTADWGELTGNARKRPSPTG